MYSEPLVYQSLPFGGVLGNVVPYWSCVHRPHQYSQPGVWPLWVNITDVSIRGRRKINVSAMHRLERNNTTSKITYASIHNLHTPYAALVRNITPNYK